MTFLIKGASMLPSQNDGFKSREILFVTNDLREEM
jgi:hypothetical protein